MAEREFPIEFSTLTPDPRPRAWLVLPEGFEAEAEPDARSPYFDASPQALIEAFVAAALEEPRTRELRRDGLQVEIRQKSPVLRFRDYVTAQAVPAKGGGALAVYSRAVVGFWDLNVNRKRVERWIAATKEKLASS
ncbi:DUF1499 domain-containing protein [Marinicauda algicola]|uniref:DUF1499 domain-containing protein n=1 Tax=Marinicauda algicola TaxID=2029849 RepID=A0A4S2H401_9PROT|nr:DUF1499 domain-containing protein [Marinicauda algicola]TGY90370.1 DUF1499 domain-containing protein [Marinicauda algicola]